MTDQDQIRGMIVRWALADSKKDAEGFAATFTEEGRFKSARGGEWRGREALRKNLADRIAANPPNRETMHLFGESLVEIDCTTHATLIAPYVAYARMGEYSWFIMTMGSFHCQLEKQDGQWLFSDMENHAIGY